MAYTFNHKEKLKSKKLTELLFKTGKAFHSFPYRIIYLEHRAEMKIPVSVGFEKDYPVKFGISVSTKNFKRAVDRNRVKRMSREAWRLHKHLLYDVFINQHRDFAIFFIYTQKEIMSYAELEKAMVKAIQKLQVLTLENA